MATRWRGLVVAAVLLWPGHGWAESALPWVFHSGATATGNGAEIQAEYYSTIAVQIEGTFVGDVTFEKKTKDATGYVAVQCRESTDGTMSATTDVPGYWECPGGAYLFRVRVSSYTSGTIVVTGHATTAVVGRGGGGAGSLHTAHTGGNEISGATSARPVIIGNGTQKTKHYGDPTEGSVQEPVPLGDSLWRVWPNFKGCIKDMEAQKLIFCFDPDATLMIDKYLFMDPDYYPWKFGWLGAGNLVGDGTNCPAIPTAVTINSGPKIKTFICLDNDGSTLFGALRMPNDWSGGNVFFSHAYIQTGSGGGAIHGDLAAQCRGLGEIPSSTWGTEVAIDNNAVTGGSANDMTQTATAVTPAGTCTGGDMLYFRYQLDATGTTTPVATLHHLGFRVLYPSRSWSN